MLLFSYKFSARDFLAEKQLKNKNPIDQLQDSFLKRILGDHACIQTRQ